MKKVEEIVAFNVREKRRELNMSQVVLAKRAGISLITVNRLEKMRQIPKIENLEAIAKILCCTRHDLYNDPDATQLNTTLNKTLEIIKDQQSQIETLQHELNCARAQAKGLDRIPREIIMLLSGMDGTGYAGVLSFLQKYYKFQDSLPLPRRRPAHKK